jgi:hypothetical protein
MSLTFGCAATVFCAAVLVFAGGAMATAQIPVTVTVPDPAPAQPGPTRPAPSGGDPARPALPRTGMGLDVLLAAAAALITTGALLVLTSRHKGRLGHGPT